MALIFKNRYGFFDQNKHKYIGYIYEEVDSGRQFSIASLINENIFYVNELDESFGPNDNVYSTLTAKSINESKNIIHNMLTTTPKI